MSDMVNRLATVIVGRQTFPAEAAEQLARDVLAAMREPTEEMAKAAYYAGGRRRLRRQ